MVVSFRSPDFLRWLSFQLELPSPSLRIWPGKVMAIWAIFSRTLALGAIQILPLMVSLMIRWMPQPQLCMWCPRALKNMLLSLQILLVKGTAITGHFSFGCQPVFLSLLPSSCTTAVLLHSYLRLPLAWLSLTRFFSCSIHSPELQSC